MATPQAPQIVKRKRPAASPFFTPVRKAKAARPAQLSPRETKQAEIQDIELEDEAIIQLRKAMKDRPTVNVGLRNQAALARQDDQSCVALACEQHAAEKPLTVSESKGETALLDKGGFEKWLEAIDTLLLQHGHQSLAISNQTPPSCDEGLTAQQPKQFSYTNPHAASEVIRPYVREESLSCVVLERQMGVNSLLEDLQVLCQKTTS